MDIEETTPPKRQPRGTALRFAEEIVRRNQPGQWFAAKKPVKSRAIAKGALRYAAEHGVKLQVTAENRVLRLKGVLDAPVTSNGAAPAQPQQEEATTP